MNINDELLKMISSKNEESLSVKELLFKLLPYWYWFAISCLIGISGAYFYTRYTPSNYSVHSLLLVKEKKSDGINLEDMFSSLHFKSDVKLENHIGILTSYELNREVIENLGWKVSWFKSIPFATYSLFGRDPYTIIFDSVDVNLPNVPLFVKSIGNNRYQISSKEDVNIDGNIYTVDLNQEGEFGKKFTSPYFNFILEKNNITNDETYYFKFNNLDEQALIYQKKLEVKTVNKNADLIQLRLEGQSPAAEIAYLNELSNVYIQFGLSEKNLTNENAIRFIDQQLLEITDTLKITSDNFSNYRSHNKVFDLGKKASLVLEKLEQLESRKSMAQMQLNYYENLYDYLDSAEEFKEMVTPSVVGIDDVTLNSLVIKLIELYSAKESLSYSLQDKNPRIQMIDHELGYAKKSLVENLKNLVYNTKQESQSIQGEIADLNAQISNYPKTEQDLINIRRMVDLNSELYTFLLKRRAEAEIKKASSISDVKVLDPANSVTVVRIGPKKMMNMAIGLFLGLIIPFLTIIIRDYFDETIHSKEDIQKLSSLPVTSIIPHNTYEELIPVLRYPRSVIAEAFRELRTKLDYFLRNDEPMVIGVHSVVPGEGKSFVALNLASILAMNNKKVLLLGADMRKPTLHKRLDLSSKKGLSTYLIGHHNMEEIVQPTCVENLDFISSGIVPPNPAELLETKEFSNLVEKLKKRYDALVIDNSPISLVTDGAIIGRYTSFDFFIIRQGYSHKSLIDFINQYAGDNNKTGIVLNDVNPKKYNDYSYNGYYGGRGYYRKAYYRSSEGYFD